MTDDNVTEAVRDMALVLGSIILHLLGVALKVSVDDEWYTVFLVFSPELYCKELEETEDGLCLRGTMTSIPYLL